jgi:hypothetical protein
MLHNDVAGKTFALAHSAANKEMQNAEPKNDTEAKISEFSLRFFIT